jgi:hypothetical protein
MFSLLFVAMYCQKVGRKLKTVDLDKIGFNAAHILYIYTVVLFSAARWKGRRVGPFENQCQQQNPTEKKE